MHASESDMVFKVQNIEKIPKFNSPVFLENKTMFGQIDEIFGPVNEVVRAHCEAFGACVRHVGANRVLTPFPVQYFTVKPKGGFTASSFEKKGKCYIGSDRLLPAKMFLEAEKPRGGGYVHCLHFRCSSLRIEC